MFRRVLVPVDFTKKNLRAVRIAARVASPRHAQVTLLHVIERVDGGEPAALSGFYKALEASARRKMKGLLSSLERVRVNAEIRYGNRVVEILRCVSEKKIDLVVMSSTGCRCGTRGRTGERSATRSASSRSVRCCWSSEAVAF